MKEGVGRNSCYSSPSGLNTHLIGLFPILPLPEFALRRPTLRVFLSRGWDPTTHIYGGEGVQDRLAAPSIGEEMPDLEMVLPIPVAFRTFTQRISRWVFQWGQFPKTCSRVCVLYGHHQHLAVGWFPVYFRYIRLRQ